MGWDSISKQSHRLGGRFNFHNPADSAIQAHDSAVRAATWSHNEDWLISADQEGVVKYWQPTFNNVKAIQAHGDPVRDLAFSPNDSKFVTACDDMTMKIFDFGGGMEESTLTGHGWDVKSVDWHPTKGLLVSGSKDHLVKLWDPRTGRCLTTLHGHKSTISRTKFEPNKGQLLATSARDQTARIFDLRMMRDICLLRGNEKDISTLTWHPFYSSLLSTGGADGSIFHYLLDEPNTPPGQATSVPPYDSADPASAPAQTIYPAHKIQHAHEYAVWSIDWHPLGHILASGSNDRVTRFWTRARPGETECFSDRYHVGEAAAAAYGTWDKRDGRRTMARDEEQELEDEAEGLQDQQMPVKQPVLPGIPGLTMPSNGAADSAPPRRFPNMPPPPPNMAHSSFPPPPPLNGALGMDMEKIKAMIASGALPPPPPPSQFGGAPGQLPPPPPNFDISKLPPGLLPPNFQPGQGFPPPPPPPGGINGALPGIGGGESGGVRRRGPLPSQEESLMEEQRRGKYRIAR